MTTRAQIRTVALALPDVSEEQEGKASTFSVAGVPFAAITAAGDLVLHLSQDDVADLLAQEPASTRLDTGGAGIPVADISGQACHYWLMRAWLEHAPRPLADQVRRGRAAVAGKVGDLPKAIGNPATRALVTNGVESLTELSEHSREEVAGWHGVGGKAMTTLDAALAEQGLRFAG